MNNLEITDTFCLILLSLVVSLKITLMKIITYSHIRYIVTPLILERNHTYTAYNLQWYCTCATAQNQWIRESLLDGHGNYLYCYECILAFIDVGSQRLVRQRKIKQELSQNTIVTKSKCEVTQSKVEKFVLLPSDETSFHDWWKDLEDDDDVEIRYPHEQHGLCGKASNRAKTSVMNDFLKFVDNNSTPNGRQADSRCPTFYFLPKFRRIEPPKASEKDHDEKLSCCLVSEFNRAQESEGKDKAGSYVIRQWLKQQRPKVAIHPHKVDFCDTCKRLEIELSRLRQIIKRLRQSGSAIGDDIKSHEETVAEIEQELKEHKCSATDSPTGILSRNDIQVLPVLEQHQYTNVHGHT